MMKSPANAAVISDPPTICAIGASAGGVRALQDFFSAIDDDLGLSYVVVIHLSPDQPSRLSAILAGRTRMPVEQVEHSLKVRPNCVYVIAPDRELVIEGDNLRSRPTTEPRSKRAPIDRFFRSVAAAHRDGLAVVLSGSGSDGALGIRAMNEAGSVIFAQDPDEAEYPTMPQSAIASRVVDFIAPVRSLVQRIAEVVRSKRALHQLKDEGAEEGFRKIIALLQGHTGHDFSHHRPMTFIRQVARRMQVSRHDSISSYVHYLRSKPEEVRALLADLLISATSFFRDRDAFVTLAQKAIRPIFKRRGSDAGVRAWVVGCATGEEAYSVAMLLLDQVGQSNFHGPIQIFASDLDEKALAVAREGRYPKTISSDVSKEQLRRFFVEDGEYYRIRKEVRDRILFASHNALKDPPFIRVDLIICRNLLIHLDLERQQQLCAVLHYALKPDGYLFLGSADSADTAPELFRLIDRHARLYVTNPMAQRAVPVMPPFAPRRPQAFPEHTHLERIDSEAELANFHLSALEHQTPPSALVDAEYRLLHLSPKAGRFICPSEGPLRTELWQLVHPELRLELKRALQNAFERGESTLTLPVTVEIEGRRRHIIEYVALTETDKGSAPHALVIFLEAGTTGPLDRVGSTDAEQADKKRRLLQELIVTRDRLNARDKQHAQALEALAAANEELQSINEEYRSTTEALETDKQQLQSANVELKTVNAELKSELAGLSSSQIDLQNLIAATEIGALFLDQQLRIKFFTPAVAKHFNITQADCGRALNDFTHRLEYDSIENDATRVLKSLIPMEAEVRTQDNRWLMMRTRPYRAFENLIGGVVVTLTDVTELKQVTVQLQSRQNELQQTNEELATKAKLLAEQNAERERKEEHIKQLLNEVDHRSKNVLSVVQAIARQTAIASPDEFVTRFSERMQTLAASHDLLVNSRWHGIEIADLIRVQLAHFKDLIGTRIKLDGPSLRLSVAAAQTLGMIMHELATNAAKYGALCNNLGHADIRWHGHQGEENDVFTISWTERGGPTVVAPSHRGFGSTVVKTMAESSLDGDVDLDFAPAGLRWHLVCPSSKVLDQFVHRAREDSSPDTVAEAKS